MTTAPTFALCAASFWGKKGPVDGIAADPIYIDVSVAPGRRKTLPVETTRHAFAYVFAGAGKFCNASGPLSGADRRGGVAGHAPANRSEAVHNRSLVLFDPQQLRRRSYGASFSDDGIRFLAGFRGKPLEEPVAWYGPIVMNTATGTQLRQARVRNISQSFRPLGPLCGAAAHWE
jgi:redox-sensitive bicupin YhaK (pirin superfamily)